MVTEKELFEQGMELEEMERPVATSLTLMTQEMFMKAEESPVAIFDRPKDLAKLSKLGHDMFGFDSCEIFNIWSHVEFMGGKVNYNAEQPFVEKALYEVTDDFAELDIDKYLDAKATQVSIESCKELRRLAGEDTPLNCINSWGPLTCAGHLVGAEALMMGLMMDPENSTRLLKYVNDFNCKAYEIELNAGQADAIDMMSMAEPSATGDMIDEGMFREFVLPYVKAEHKVIRDSGLYSMLHICGNTVGNMEAMIECGSNAISVEQTVDPTEVHNIARGKVAMFGNVGPVDPLWQGTPEQVTAAVNRSIDGGFRFIAPGCSFTPLTPGANLLAMTAAVKNCGKSCPKER